MSLRAKLEAVIYAAEEPVTLAQLAFLFARDAMAWKAESTAPTQDEEMLIPVAPAPEYPEATGSLATVEPAGSAEPEATQDSEESELEARREERRREREVRLILREILDELMADYASDQRGIEIREIAGGFRMGTKPEMHDSVRALVKSMKPTLKLSLPALETLAVLAYKQPVTAPEVAEIRGVDSAGVLGSLMSRKLIATAGRKQVIGRPMLYKTTKEFLVRFGLRDLNELPSMEEFEKMAALELNEDSEPSETTEPTEAPGELFTEADMSKGNMTHGDLTRTNTEAPGTTPQTHGDLTRTNAEAPEGLQSPDASAASVDLSAGAEHVSEPPAKPAPTPTA